MKRKRIERWALTSEGPAWEYGEVLVKPGMDGGHYFMLDGKRYEIGDTEILCNGEAVGRIADWGKTYFVGPKEAPTREEFRHKKSEAKLEELTI